MTQAVSLESRDGLKLTGDWMRPAGAAHPPVVVFAHGWGSSRASARNRAIAQALLDAGMAALLFDFRGHGESAGDAEQSTLEDQELDLAAAIDWVEARGELGPIGIAGSSSGAAVAIAVAARDLRVRALVLRAPSAAAQRALAARVEAPTLVVQGESDPLLGRNAVLAESLHCEHRLCSVPGAGHLFEEPGTFEIASRETVQWFRRHLLGERGNAGGVRYPAAKWPAVAPSVTGLFRDREHAGLLLARELASRRSEHPLVLALPRGGIDVAEPIARELGTDLDVFVARKIRAPDQPELGIGAVAEGDVVYWNDALVRDLGLGPHEKARQLKLARSELEERVAAYRRVAARVPLAGRALIVVDDGVATGATLKAALLAIRTESPASLTVALPGGASDTLAEISSMVGAANLVALLAPEPFWAVGQLYESFRQVSNERVCSVLREYRARRRGASQEKPPAPRT